MKFNVMFNNLIYHNIIHVNSAVNYKSENDTYSEVQSS